MPEAALLQATLVLRAICCCCWKREMSKQHAALLQSGEAEWPSGLQLPLATPGLPSELVTMALGSAQILLSAAAKLYSGTALSKKLSCMSALVPGLVTWARWASLLGLCPLLQLLSHTLARADTPTASAQHEQHLSRDPELLGSQRLPTKARAAPQSLPMTLCCRRLPDVHQQGQITTLFHLLHQASYIMVGFSSP